MGCSVPIDLQRGCLAASTPSRKCPMQTWQCTSKVLGNHTSAIRILLAPCQWLTRGPIAFCSQTGRVKQLNGHTESLTAADLHSVPSPASAFNGLHACTETYQLILLQSVKQYTYSCYICKAWGYPDPGKYGACASDGDLHGPLPGFLYDWAPVLSV
jgi:hypothetical protein